MRIRTIKPEFFTHEGIFELEHKTKLPIRLAFIGLWGVADRDGKFRWEPRRIGVQILPYDEISFADILDSLQEGGFIIRSQCGAYGRIPSFDKHQCINTREAASTIPDDVFTCTHVHAREPTYHYKGVNIPPKLRNFIISRDGGKCVRCNATEDLTVDHIFPQSIGGTHAIKNLRTLCRSCNSARPVVGDALIEDLAKDGYKLSDMKCTCMHVHAQGEGKGKEQGKEHGKEGNGKGKDWRVTARELLDGSKFAILERWIGYRKQIKKPLKDVSILELAQEWKALQASQIEAMVSASIKNGYQGLFPDKAKPATTDEPPLRNYYEEWQAAPKVGDDPDYVSTGLDELFLKKP